MRLNNAWLKTQGLVSFQLTFRTSYQAPVERGRDARFRIEVVVVAYQHTCALTGYRLTTIGMESIVDAAHIHAFSSSRNNDPRNGLALCKNVHWQFDRGLWTIEDDYRVKVNRDAFVEAGVPGQRLGDFDGHRLFVPGDPRYWPDPACLAWHRKHKSCNGYRKCLRPDRPVG